MTEPKDELLLDHEYDGIKELDNRLPGWWLWLFYLTIIFSVFYMGYYHVLGRGPLQAEEYDLEMAEAQRLGLGVAYESWGADVQPATDDETMAEGQLIFTAQCAVCHLPDGGGLIGPNMTDDYFIHGPEFADSVLIIEEGVVEKGMISWKTQMPREEILAVASYIHGLRGTSPDKAKAPEGDLAPAAGAEAGDEAQGEPEEPPAEAEAEAEP